MNSLNMIAAMLTLAALLGILNARTLRLPNTIGILVFAILASLIVVAVDPWIPGYNLQALSRRILGIIDLPQTLLKGVLSLLLFAGALQVDLGELWARRMSVLALALLATLLSVGMFGGAMWMVFPWIGVAMPLAWCFVLGAILAPTDPVSVVAMLRRIGLPSRIQAVFAGESLFNDGVGVVLFSVFLNVATGSGHIGFAPVAMQFSVEAFGGMLLGLASGWIAVTLMRTVEDAHLLLLISLALATGTFSLANALGTSGPIAVVVAGLMLGSHRSREAVSDVNRTELMTFWSLMDEVLNSILFLLIGFEILAVGLQVSSVLAVLIAIVISIIVRIVSVFISTLPIRLPWHDRRAALVVLTWGGLRGGISVALALGLPDNAMRPWLLSVSYGVVVFTIIVQGLTIQRVARHLYPPGDPVPVSSI